MKRQGRNQDPVKDLPKHQVVSLRANENAPEDAATTTESGVASTTTITTASGRREQLRSQAKESPEATPRAAKPSQPSPTIAKERRQPAFGAKLESNKTRISKEQDDMEACQDQEDAAGQDTGTEDGASYPAHETDGMMPQINTPTTTGCSHRGKVHTHTTSPGAYSVGGRHPTDSDEEINNESSTLDCSGEVQNASARVVAEEITVLTEISELRSKIVTAQVISVEKHPSVPIEPPSGNKTRWLAVVAFFLLAVVGIIIAISVKKNRGDKSNFDDSLIESQPTGSNASVSGKACFPDRVSLLNAVDAYLANNSNKTDVARKYGWPIGTWCVSSVTGFHELFDATRNPSAATFDEALNEWDVSQGKEFYNMFYQASRFNQNISMWNVSSAIHMDSMFYRAIRFNQSLSTWDVASVVTMNDMFLQATDFNGNLSSWDVSRVVNMASMFANAASFNSDISHWQVSNVVDMSSMFEAASHFNQNIGAWSMSSVTSTESMFKQATAFNQDISNWNLSAIENAQNMFRGDSSFQQNLCAWRSFFLAINKTDSMFVDTNCSNQIVELMRKPFYFCEPCNEK